MWEGDYRAIVDHAIAAGNNTLWETFIVHHSPYTQRKGPDELRSHMRAKARQSAELLRIWMRVERNHREQLRRNSVRFGRSNKSYIRMEAKRKDDHFANLEKNRAQIEAGQHWGWLKFLARHYLHEPHKMDEIVDDPQIVEKALLNCFDFLSSNVPTWKCWRSRVAQQSLWYCMQHVLRLQRSAKRDRWKASRLIYCRRSKPTVLADRLIRKAKPKDLKQS